MESLKRVHVRGIIRFLLLNWFLTKKKKGQLLLAVGICEDLFRLGIVICVPAPDCGLFLSYRCYRCFASLVVKDIGMLSSFQWEKKAINTHVHGFHSVCTEQSLRTKTFRSIVGDLFFQKWQIYYKSLSFWYSCCLCWPDGACVTMSISWRKSYFQSMNY